MLFSLSLPFSYLLSDITCVLIVEHSRHITTSIHRNVLSASRSVLLQGVLMTQACPSARSLLRTTFHSEPSAPAFYGMAATPTHFLCLIFLHNAFYQLTYGVCLCVKFNMFIFMYKFNFFHFPLIHKLPVEMNSVCLFYCISSRKQNSLAHSKHTVNMY